MWFSASGNHICILTLAWAYVLSARWAEVVPGATALEYTDSLAVWKQSGTTSANRQGGGNPVDLGPASDRAARWWAAVVAPGQGWTTGIVYNGYLLPAPWSTNVVQAGKSFVLSRTSTTAAPPPHLPPSFEVAASYISAYAVHHGVEDQSRAAFAAALMLPSAGRIKRTVCLPTPRPPSSDSSNMPPASPVRRDPLWGEDVRQLDRLLTLSCNNFIQSLLSSAIFEPGVPCNVCGAWTQGAFAVLDSGQAKDDLQVLTSTLMARTPRFGFLWLGAALLSIYKVILGGMRGLFYPIDLTLAGWTDALMSFIQQPVINLAPADEAISRANECRLMFLSQSMDHAHPPIVPFEPFGVTAIADCTLEVREHARCRSSHGLYYSGWTWDCPNGAPATTPQHPPTLLDAGVPNHESGGHEMGDDSQIPVDYSRMDRENDSSESITRSIFMWLRETDGFPVAERDIREHEWINNLDESDDESASPEGDGRSTAARRNVNVGPWIARTVTYRRESFY